MKKELMKKCIKLSRIFITLMVFIFLNAYFLYENDPQWVFTIIVSFVVFFLCLPTSKVSIFLINKGDKIKNKLLKLLFYILLLPIIFIIILLGILIFNFFLSMDSLSLRNAVLMMFAGVGILICILVPYFQTLIILFLRYFFKKNNKTTK